LAISISSFEFDHNQILLRVNRQDVDPTSCLRIYLLPAKAQPCSS